MEGGKGGGEGGGFRWFKLTLKRPYSIGHDKL